MANLSKITCLFSLSLLTGPAVPPAAPSLVVALWFIRDHQLDSDFVVRTVLEFLDSLFRRADVVDEGVDAVAERLDLAVDGPDAVAHPLEVVVAPFEAGVRRRA